MREGLRRKHRDQWDWPVQSPVSGGVERWPVWLGSRARHPRKEHAWIGGASLSHSSHDLSGLGSPDKMQDAQLKFSDVQCILHGIYLY